MKNFLILFTILGSIIYISACDQRYTPKPTGYPRIDLPPHEYQQLKGDHPYTFEFSKYARSQPHRSEFAKEHWIDIKYPRFNATIQVTYKKIDKNTDDFDEMIMDSHKLASKHQIKAHSIESKKIKSKTGKDGILFRLKGDVPSQFQFYMSDTTKNFVRGALYFNTATKNDSLAPVIDYVKKDIVHMLNTLEWKK